MQHAHESKIIAIRLPAGSPLASAPSRPIPPPVLSPTVDGTRTLSQRGASFTMRLSGRRRFVSRDLSSSAASHVAQSPTKFREDIFQLFRLQTAGPRLPGKSGVAQIPIKKEPAAVSGEIKSGEFAGRLDFCARPRLVEESLFGRRHHHPAAYREVET